MTLAILAMSGVSVAASGGSNVPLTERITAAVGHEEPSWRIASPLATRPSSLQPSADGIWDGAGYRINVDLAVDPSSLDAAKALDHLWRIYGSPPPQTSGRRHFRKANVLVWIQVLPSGHGDKRDSSGPTAAAVAMRLAEIIDNLIDIDVKVDGCVNDLHPSPLPPPTSQRDAFFRDVGSGCLNRVERALDSGADANARDPQGTPVLHKAVTKGHRDVVLALLRAGADPNVVGGNRGPAMFRVLSRPSYRSAELPNILADRLAILDALLEYRANIEASDSAGRTFLLEVARTFASDGWSAVFLRALIERGANLAARDHDGRTALMLAAQGTPNEIAEALKVLLAAGADVNARDPSGKTAMAFARGVAVRYAFKESVSVLQILADAGGAE